MNQRSVAVTGANGQIGRLVIAALANCNFRVTALVRGHESLSGCITVGDWLASKSAMTVLQDAHAVIHLAGSLNPSDHDYNKANITPTANNSLLRTRLRHAAEFYTLGGSLHASWAH